MRTVIGSDHAGLGLKVMLSRLLRASGDAGMDVGTNGAAPVDYPDFVAANKVRGLCHDRYSTHQGVEHDDMNVLVLGARVIGPALAAENKVKANETKSCG